MVIPEEDELNSEDKLGAMIATLLLATGIRAKSFVRKTPISFNYNCFLPLMTEALEFLIY